MKIITLRRMASLLVMLAATVLLALTGCTTQSTTSINNPLVGLRLYHDDTSHAAEAERELMAAGKTDLAKKLQSIAGQPTAIWLTGSPTDPDTVRRIMPAAVREQAVPVFVLYNIPMRDIGAGKSGGGAPDNTAYLAWIAQLTELMGNQKAIVIVEPDGVSAVADGHLTGPAAADRLALLRQTLTQLNKPNLFAFLDAGNAGWKTPGDMAGPLKAAGIDQGRGIAVNVANFYSDAMSTDYATSLSRLLGNVGAIIDTSRNGRGAAPTSDLSWCNPPGRAIGRPPSIGGEHDLVQAWLWIKTPGDSDGACRPGEPPAGQFWLDYALQLVS